MVVESEIDSGVSSGGTRSAFITVVSEATATLRFLLVVGILVGVVVAGVGSRLAMYVLRLTSPERVRGLTSDDGFIIGRFTLGGTYTLLVLGAAVGVIGVAAYLAVRPWLVGPAWFRRATVAVASGAVVGSMLVHEDGIDFHVLKPKWLAIGLFVALPALFGWAIAASVERASRLDVSGDRRFWLPPILLVAAFPFIMPLVGALSVGLLVWVSVRRYIPSAMQNSRVAGLAIRAVWLGVAVAGVVALIRDVQALT